MFHLCARKDWILVAAFDGPADDSTLAGATRDLVCAALDQPEIVSPVPDGQMRIALERAGKPRNTRVDATQPLIDLATPSFVWPTGDPVGP